MTEKPPPQADEDLILLRAAAVAKILDFTPGGFANWIASDTDDAKAFKALPCVRRGRAKLWRKSDVRRYVEGQVKAKA